jgi:hypothetical protein
VVYNCEQYRENLIQKIQALSKDLEKLAPGLVGDDDLMTNFELHLKFPPDGVPTITLMREHMGQEATRITFHRGETERE